MPSTIILKDVQNALEESYDQITFHSTDYDIVAQMPTDIQSSIEQQYTDPLDLTVDPRIVLAANTIGQKTNLPAGISEYLANFSGQFDITSLNIWQGGSRLSLSFEIIFVAETSVEKDIVEPLKNLIKLSVPRRTAGKNLKAPFSPKDNERLSVQIGRLMYLPDVIINSVAPTLSYPLLTGGIPSRVPVQIAISTRQIVTRTLVDETFFVIGSG